MPWIKTLAVACALSLTVASYDIHAQDAQTLPSATPLPLSQAEAIAIANQPRIMAAQLRSRAAAARVHEARSAYFPAVGFNATGVRVADTGTSTAAGALTTSSISDHFAYGGQITQLVTDFGRTSALAASSKLNSQAQEDFATLTKAQVRCNVRDAYYQVLGAEAVLRAARAAQSNRHLVARQLSALAQNELRSTVDVNFAEVLASEADLAVVRAQSAMAQQRAHLATAMGATQSISAPLIDPVTPDTLPLDPDSLEALAQNQRADLNAAEAQQKAAQQIAAAEKRSGYPTLGLGGAAGQIPFHDHTLHDSYAAAGFNLSIPIFNGWLFAARRAEAESEANARASDVKELHLEITEQVRNNWQRANEAFQSLDVTARLVVQSKEALHLAQARYDAGLGSIVELNEAQVNETSAEIAAADANYTYLSRRAELDFAAGLLN
ncbi:TolC family protein [Granulicella sibirica]|uniref:Cobalt-zinc-cadmium resistance protein CzcA n=1 Tax=Granulicella sibirica TaxID=2479048 RepID=A0A4Q0ST97_9BACT|nr:TolC family protein [Granulicella sibirica]RXH54145.1 Cobalt-zinc-cadmium resistance protein CzcA [Granulicella sibirica]